MPPDSLDCRSVIDLAFQGLQEERTACVDRLQKVLSSAGNELEIEGYLRRIQNINAALVRLAGAHIVEHAY
ncbi:MAG: hypothetical protein SFW09_19450 [Hyphomicrobiaceae bacterium]|nr:hypothetical protein [Hyphomicrobiaceae bacterium]